MMTIIPPGLTANLEGAIQKIKEIIEKEGGEILSTNSLGERELSYPIKRNRTGNYILFDLKLPDGAIPRLTGIFNLTQEILRCQIVKKIAVKKIERKKEPEVVEVSKELPEVKTDIDLELGL